MSDLLEKKTSRSDLPVSTVPDTALPQVLDGAVYLPAGHPVATESEEFDQLLRQHLPQDIAADVMGQWHGVSPRASRLQWIVSLVCLLAAFALLYFYFPNTRLEKLKEHEGMEIRDFSEVLPLFSPYSSAYSAAAREFNQGNYHAVCQFLEKPVKKIIQTGDKTADRVLVLYFMAVRENQKGKSGSMAAEEAVRMLQKLIERFPDNPNWRQFEFVLNPRISRVMEYEQIGRTLDDPQFSRSSTGMNFILRRLGDSAFALDRLADLKSMTKGPKYTSREVERLQEAFDLYEVKLRLSRWLLKGYETGKSSLPDNEEDPGVLEREDALKLALKHQHSNCRDFWEARLFIAKILCRYDVLFNDIYWNGEYHKTKASLEQEIKDCRERLNGGQQL